MGNAHQQKRYGRDENTKNINEQEIEQNRFQSNRRKRIEQEAIKIEKNEHRDNRRAGQHRQ